MLSRTLKVGFAVLFMAVFVPSHAEIAEWYKRDIASHLSNADSIVQYRTDNISLASHHGRHYVYRLDTTTLEILKGSAAPTACYYFDSEELWDFDEFVGEVRLAILAEPETGECRLIDAGHSAPGTDEYVQLFKDALDK